MLCCVWVNLPLLSFSPVSHPGMVRGATKSLVIDLALLLEGRQSYELPETLIGACRWGLVLLLCESVSCRVFVRETVFGVGSRRQLKQLPGCSSPLAGVSHCCGRCQKAGSCASAHAGALAEVVSRWRREGAGGAVAVAPQPSRAGRHDSST